MTVKAERAARLAPATARGTSLYARNDTSETASAQAGKAFAVWLYCIDSHSLSETVATFTRHPEWRSA